MNENASVNSQINGGPFGSDIQAAAAASNYQRQRQMTLGDLLLENRIIFSASSMIRLMTTLIISS